MLMKPEDLEVNEAYYNLFSYYSSEKLWRKCRKRLYLIDLAPEPEEY